MWACLSHCNPETGRCSASFARALIHFPRYSVRLQSPRAHPLIGVVSAMQYPFQICMCVAMLHTIIGLHILLHLPLYIRWWSILFALHLLLVCLLLLGSWCLDPSLYYPAPRCISLITSSTRIVLLPSSMVDRYFFIFSQLQLRCISSIILSSSLRS